ncbi:MAG: hypothetical protein J0I06_01490 [Planctomycetes bacterium]|nr:hypothetical protein [Planctomycetota bacterium]
MGSYAPPVDQLLKLGRPIGLNTKVDYVALGIGPEHVPDLIRLLKDETLFEKEPEAYAQIHAWRALGQLRAREAIGPLLDVMAENAEAEDFSDWILEELPVVLGSFGPETIPIVVVRIDRQNARRTQEHAAVLKEVGRQHPEARAEAVSHLCRLLETAGTNDPTLNAFLISNLIDLKAAEALPAIERAYATNNVDLSLHGGLEEAKFYMGLGPKPQHAQPPLTSPRPSGQNAKQRFNERQRQKKLAKKQKKRKGK